MFVPQLALKAGRYASTATAMSGVIACSPRNRTERRKTEQNGKKYEARRANFLERKTSVSKLLFECSNMP